MIHAVDLIDNNEIEDYRQYPYSAPTLTAEEINVVDRRLALMTRKGVFPYEYIDTFDKFEETSLPPKNEFYSSLTTESISEEDYAHAQVVFKELKMRNLGDYHDFYLLTDVLLLADVFETFRSTCQAHYDLDAAHMYTSPSKI